MNAYYVDIMKPRRKNKISKYLTKILRHRPQKVGLSLDPGGWINLNTLVSALTKKGMKVSFSEIIEVIYKSEKPRFSIKPAFGVSKRGGRKPQILEVKHNPEQYSIRAAYGHSFPVDLNIMPTEPPERLYHGTAEQFLDSIFTEGLKPMGRQFVHLYQNSEGALDVGGRKGKAVLLVINTSAMYTEGCAFYQAGDGIWLTHNVPPTYIQLNE